MKKLLLIIVVLFISCEPPSWVYDARSFVLHYAGMESISLWQEKGDKMLWHVSFGDGKLFTIRSEGAGKAVFDRLCEKHGDVTYNRAIRIYADKRYDYRCAEDFVNIEITSSADWDADHPAGSSLGDIVRLISNTPLPYIRSGYTQKYSEEKGGEYYPIDKLVSELTPDDMMLLSNGIKYRFTQPPTLSREHTLTVRLTTDEGKVFTASVDAVF